MVKIEIKFSQDGKIQRKIFCSNISAERVEAHDYLNSFVGHFKDFSEPKDKFYAYANWIISNSHRINLNGRSDVLEYENTKIKIEVLD